MVAGWRADYFYCQVPLFIFKLIEQMLNFSEHFPVQTTITFGVIKKSARPHYGKSHLMGIHM